MSPRKKAGEEAAPEEELSNEETCGRLEEVLAHIEEGECSLEETFQYYEKGMKLVKACHDKIDRVEKQIQVLGGEGEES